MKKLNNEQELIAGNKANQWKEYYEKEASVYEKRFEGRAGFVFNLVQIKTMREMFDGDFSDKTVLEIGPGTGRFTIALSKLFRKVIAFDQSKEMLFRLKKKSDFSQEKIEIKVGDAFHLPYRDKTFDAVCAFRFIHLFSEENQNKLVREMFRVLKPGGKLVIDFNSVWNGIFLSYLDILRRSSKSERYLSPLRIKHLPYNQHIDKIKTANFHLFLWLLPTALGLLINDIIRSIPIIKFFGATIFVRWKK